MMHIIDFVYFYFFVFDEALPFQIQNEKALPKNFNNAFILIFILLLYHKFIANGLEGMYALHHIGK